MFCRLHWVARSTCRCASGGDYQANVVMKQVHYRGIPTWKNVFDLWVIQEIIHETQPEMVVEIGSKFGGTTLWLSDVMKSVAPGSVVSVDLKRPRIDFPENVEHIEGNSIAPETIAQVQSLCADHRTMVMADGNHAAKHVLTSSCLWPDGCAGMSLRRRRWNRRRDGLAKIHARPACGRAAFLAESSDFEIDREREKFILTYAAAGFLKRALP